MRTQFFLIVLAAAWASAPTTAGAKGGRKALDQLQGSWEVVKADPTFFAGRLTFRGDTMAAEFKDPQQGAKVARIRTDPAARPATIDVLFREEKTLGIYEVTGDTLKLCLAERGAERPSKFVAAKGVLLVVLKRAHGPRTLTLEHALGLLPRAASMSNAEMALAAGPDPWKIQSQSLSLVLFSLDPTKAGKDPGVKKDFQFLGKGLPRPSQIVAAMSRSQQNGYVSFLQPEYFTQATIDAGEDSARGTVSFRCKGLYEGTVQYRAEKQEAAWVITEFRLPHYGVRVVRNKEGVWERSRIPSDK